VIGSSSAQDFGHCCSRDTMLLSLCKNSSVDVSFCEHIQYMLYGRAWIYFFFYSGIFNMQLQGIIYVYGTFYLVIIKGIVSRDFVVWKNGV
jgi:hypothetical protein